MNGHPESFASADILSVASPEIVPETPVRRHDAEFMRALADDFGREIYNLAQGSALDRPTGEKQDVPASEVFGVSRERGKEANRTSANEYLHSLAIDGDYSSFTSIQHQKNPNNVLTLETFTWLSEWTRSLCATPEARREWRARNMYSDYGKAKPVVQWARRTLKNTASMDHDDIIPVLFRPEHEAARKKLAPSFDKLPPMTQERVVRGLECKFHLPQLNNGQALPKHLESFYELEPIEREMLLNQEVFDVGGAQGDTITNGTATLNESMTRRLRGTIGILLSSRHAHLPPAERAPAVYEEVLKFHSRRWNLGYDTETKNPKARAMTRIGMMFRDLTDGQIAQIPDIFDTHLGEITQEHILDFANATGYEEEGGAVWSMYSSTLAARFLRDTMKSGVLFEQAMAGSLRLLARINEAARQDIDVTDAPMTNVVARDLMESIEKDWRQFLTRPFKAEKFSPGQARVYLGNIPALVSERDSRVTNLGHLGDLQIPPENGYWIAAGGGGDAYATAYAATLMHQEEPIILDPWGEPDRMRNAIPVGDTGRIFMATPETKLEGMRYTEDLLAARGMRVFMVCLQRQPDGKSNLYDDFQRVFEYTDIDPSYVGVVDTGGDILEYSTLKDRRPSRDHLSLVAAARIVTDLGSVASNTFILAGGVDAPDYAHKIVEATNEPLMHRLSDMEARLFQMWLENDGLPSADPARYSRMINTLYYATHPRVIEDENQYAVQPLLLPVSQALARKRARPATVAMHHQMSSLLILDTVQLAGTLKLMPR